MDNLTLVQSKILPDDFTKKNKKQLLNIIIEQNKENYGLKRDLEYSKNETQQLIITNNKLANNLNDKKQELLKIKQELLKKVKR